MANAYGQALTGGAELQPGEPLPNLSPRESEESGPRPSGSPGSSRRRAYPLPGAGYLLDSALFIVAYVLVDWLSYLQPVLQLGITPWNP